MLTDPRARGASLLELLVVLAILGVAAAAVTRIATRQQRLYVRLAGRTMADAQVREGSEVLVSALAGIAPAAGDIYDGGLGRSWIDFRSPLATALLCASPIPGASEVDLLHIGLAPGAGRTGGLAATDDSWLAAGDSLLLYDAAADTAGASIVWRAHLVSATAALTRECAPAADSGQADAIRATLSPPTVGALEPHAPARIFRRTRYALYTAGDGRPYLGFSDCRPLVRVPACSPMQPVAGPYLRAAAGPTPGPGGLVFEYLDAGGALTDDRFAVAAITIDLRADVALPGHAPEAVGVRRTVALRNTPR